MDELEYRRRILKSQDRTLAKLDEMNKDITELGRYVERLQARVAHLETALAAIRDHDGTDSAGIPDMWSQASAFVECRNIARAALESGAGS